MQVEFGDEIFFFEFVHYLNLTVSRSGASLLRTSNSNLHVATCLGLRRPRRLVPTSGVRISQFGLGCLHRKQAQHPPTPSRTSAFVTCCCRCAPRPDAFGWACVLLTALTSAGAPQDRARLPERQQTSPGSPAAYFSSNFSACPSFCLYFWSVVSTSLGLCPGRLVLSE